MSSLDIGAMKIAQDELEFARTCQPGTAHGIGVKLGAAWNAVWRVASGDEKSMAGEPAFTVEHEGETWIGFVVVHEGLKYGVCVVEMDKPAKV